MPDDLTAAHDLYVRKVNRKREEEKREADRKKAIEVKPAVLSLWPFGTDISNESWPSGCLAGIMNVIWWFVGGLGIALPHLDWGLLFCITIVDIPFGVQHLKLMKLETNEAGTIAIR